MMAAGNQLLKEVMTNRASTFHTVGHIPADVVLVGHFQVPVGISIDCLVHIDWTSKTTASECHSKVEPFGR